MAEGVLRVPTGAGGTCIVNLPGGLSCCCCLPAPSRGSAGRRAACHLLSRFLCGLGGTLGLRGTGEVPSTRDPFASPRARPLPGLRLPEGCPFASGCWRGGPQNPWVGEGVLLAQAPLPAPRGVRAGAVCTRGSQAHTQPPPAAPPSPGVPAACRGWGAGQEPRRPPASRALHRWLGAAVGAGPPPAAPPAPATLGGVSGGGAATPSPREEGEVWGRVGAPPAPPPAPARGRRRAGLGPGPLPRPRGAASLPIGQWPLQPGRPRPVAVTALAGAGLSGMTSPRPPPYAHWEARLSVRQLRR